MTRAVDLSIVIVNYRCWDDLALCLASLEPLKVQSNPNTEVIVVDNQSGDGRFQTFQKNFPWVIFLQSPGNFGFAHGCNLGAARATGAELLFLNPDCIDPGGAVAGFWQAKLAHKADLFSVRQTDKDGSPQRVFGVFPGLANQLGLIRAILRLVNPDKYPDPRQVTASFRQVDWLSGSALMISARCYTALEGWCEEFWMYSEDVDLCRRATDAGYVVGYSADHTLIHKHGGASRKNPETAALTKTEVVISRHLYAARNIQWPSRPLYHALLMLSRYVSRLPAFLLSFLPVARLKVEGKIFGRLTRYYAGALARKSWISPRSLHRLPADSELRGPGGL